MFASQALNHIDHSAQAVYNALPIEILETQKPTKATPISKKMKSVSSQLSSCGKELGATKTNRKSAKKGVSLEQVQG